MRGIRKPGKAAITATAGLLGLTLVPFQSFAAEAATSGCATAGVLAEREAKFAELLNKADQARALVAEKNFNEADKLYRELISELSATPGEIIREQLDKVVAEHNALKVQWGRHFMNTARDFYLDGEYVKAKRAADDAFLVDPGCLAEVEDFKRRCDDAMLAEDFRNAVSSVEVMSPDFAMEQQRVEDLMRRAVGFYEANALEDARATCEAIFRIDPYNTAAAELLERVYEKLYTYGSARRSADFRAMFAYMAWNWVTPVFPDKSDSTLATLPMELAASSGVMSKLDRIVIDAFQVDDMDISNAIKTLDRLVKTYDPDGTGVQFLITLSEEEIAFDKSKNQPRPHVSLDLQRIPASEVLKYICMLTDTKYFVDKSGRININLAGALEEEEFPIRSAVVTRISRGKINPDGAPGLNGFGGMPGAPMNGENSFPGIMPVTPDASSAANSGSMPFGPVPSSGSVSGGSGASGFSPAFGGASGFGSNPRYEDADAVSAGLSGRAPGVGASSNDGRSSSGRLGSSGSSSRTSGSGIGGGSGSSFGGSIGGGSGSSFGGGTGSMTPGGSTGGTNGSGADLSSLSRGSVDLAQEAETIDFAELEAFFTAHGIPFDGEEATIVYNPISNTIIARNTSANLSKMAKLINVLNAQEPMVLIEAKVLELSENDIEQLGFNWFLNITQLEEKDTNISYEQPDNPIRNNDSYTLLEGLKIFPNFGESLFGENYDVDLSLSINAVSQNKNVEIINAPRLLTTNNSEAILTVSETRYYPSDWEYDDDEDDEDSDSGNSWSDSDSTELKAPEPQFDDGGTELGITFHALPQIDSDMATITLTIRLDTRSLAEKWHYPGGYDQRVYSISNNATGNPEATLINRMTTDIWMPVYAERSLSAKVRVFDGETIVIGGMIDSSTESYSDKWPILGDIPLIGRLFRQQNDRETKSNMLVFITTRLVNDDGVPLRNERTLRGVPTFKN